MPTVNPQDSFTTTTYAVLGLLNIQPWSAYELAAQMNHCFGAFWPRAASRSYAEAERLVSHGLAEAKRDYIGRRPRTTYSITGEGRDALRAWFDAPFRPFTLEFEGLVRVFLSRAGTKTQLLATLERVREEAEGILAFAGMAAEAYYASQAPFQEEEGHIRAFVFTFMVPFAKHMKAWAERTEAEVESWENLSPEGKRERAIQIIREAWIS